MKTVVLCLALAALAAAEYQTLNDNFDFSKLSTEQIRGVAQCLNDEGPCDELLTSYKQYYPAAIIENCGSCNAAQKQIARIFFTRLEKEWPQEFEKFKFKNDPQGRYWGLFYSTLKNSE